MNELDVAEPGISVKGQTENTSITELLLRAEMHMKYRNLISSWETEQGDTCLWSNLPKFLPGH